MNVACFDWEFYLCDFLNVTIEQESQMVTGLGPSANRHPMMTDSYIDLYMEMDLYDFERLMEQLQNKPPKLFFIMSDGIHCVRQIDCVSEISMQQKDSSCHVEMELR